MIDETIEQLKDVKCEHCGRVIGQRSGALYVPAGGAETIYHKSSRIRCPFVGCRAWQIFAVNRNKNENLPSINVSLLTKPI